MIRCCFIRPKILAQSRPQSPRYLTEWVRVIALSLNLVHSRGFSLKKNGRNGRREKPRGNEIDEIDISRPSHFLDKKPWGLVCFLSPKK